MNQTPLNPDALSAGARAHHETYLLKETWGNLDVSTKAASIERMRIAVSAYLAVAQPVVNSVEDLVITRIGLALANAAFNEGMNAGIRACNESLEGEPFVKPVSPYRPEAPGV